MRLREIRAVSTEASAPDTENSRCAFRICKNHIRGVPADLVYQLGECKLLNLDETAANLQARFSSKSSRENNRISDMLIAQWQLTVWKDQDG